jgi:hypothetical protein
MEKVQDLSNTEVEHETVGGRYMKDRTLYRHTASNKMYLKYKLCVDKKGTEDPYRHQYYDCQKENEEGHKCTVSIRTDNWRKKPFHDCKFKKKREAVKIVGGMKNRRVLSDKSREEPSEKKFLELVVCLIAGCGIPVKTIKKSAFKQFLTRLLEMGNVRTLTRYIRTLDERKFNVQLKCLSKTEFKRKYNCFKKVGVGCCSADSVSINNNSLFAPVLQCPHHKDYSMHSTLHDFRRRHQRHYTHHRHHLHKKQLLLKKPLPFTTLNSPPRSSSKSPSKGFIRKSLASSIPLPLSCDEKRTEQQVLCSCFVRF